jgi:hypothetical protein
MDLGIQGFNGNIGVLNMDSERIPHHANGLTAWVSESIQLGNIPNKKT